MTTSYNNNTKKTYLKIETELGIITLRLRYDAAPITVQYICDAVTLGLYTNTCFYRSDFVIQCGLYGTNKTNPNGNIPINETNQPNLTTISNVRGTVSIAHFDIPDNGNTEFFINLKSNIHLDTVYGGYCVFAHIENNDITSFNVIDTIATTITNNPQLKPKILRMYLE